MKYFSFFLYIFILFFAFPVFSKEIIISDVPFTSQAPFAAWDDERQQEGCEEASMTMSLYYALNKSLSKSKALEEILNISHYEDSVLGFHEDTSLQTTFEVMKGYFNYPYLELYFDISIEDIKKEIDKGHVVMAPMLGQKLKNPNFTPPGPLYHMIVLFGYDDEKKEFITHDPGTRHGKNYRYSFDIIKDALSDYPDGFLKPMKEKRTGMIVVKKADEMVLESKGTIVKQENDTNSFYYVAPSLNKILSLNNPWQVFELMAKEGIGISNNDLEKIPVGVLDTVYGKDTDKDGLSDEMEIALHTNINEKDTDKDGFTDKEEIINHYSALEALKQFVFDEEFTKKQAGNILLQVEESGQAWYVNPSDNRRYFLGRPVYGFEVLKQLSKGFSKNELEALFDFFKNLFYIMP